jgi:hypothetical protein
VFDVERRERDAAALRQSCIFLVLKEMQISHSLPREYLTYVTVIPYAFFTR